MRKYRYLLLGLILLSVLAFPSAALAQDSLKSVGLQSTGPDFGYAPDWHFVVTGLASQDQAPATIRIHWSVGDTIISLKEFKGGIAYYDWPASKVPYGAFPVNGIAKVNGTWDGTFNTASGPCAPPAINEITPPVPELPVVTLLGLGLAGLGTFLFLKRKTLLAKLS